MPAHFVLEMVLPEASELAGKGNLRPFLSIWKIEVGDIHGGKILDFSIATMT